MTDLKIIAIFVADNYGITLDALKLKTRRRAIVVPRQVAHWLARKHTSHSLATIAATIGQKDHATVLHSIRTINNHMETDKAFCNDMIELNQLFIRTVKPHIEYNHMQLIKMRSDRRFEIQRRYYERKVVDIYNEAKKLLRYSNITLNESHVMEGYLKSKMLQRISKAEKKFNEIKLRS